MGRDLNRRTFLAASAAAGAGGALAASAAPAAAAPARTPDAPAGPATPATPAAPAVDVPDLPVREAARHDPTEATLAEAVVLIRTGRLTAADLVQAYRDRIEKYDKTYQAYAEVTGKQALLSAYAADQAHKNGKPAPLAGVPLCVKDNYFTKGVPTRANSFIFEKFIPATDATAVARLKAAGGILLGKGQMGPLATTRATTPNGMITTVNAWTPDNPLIDPGGSSTGPACAVAGRMASSSIGTQTGGSIVNPANRQNLTGLKPTMGRVSLNGVIPLSYTRDHCGPIARDAMDAAIMLTVMAGPDDEDPRTRGLPRLPNLVRAATPVVSAKGKVRLRRPTRIGVPPGFTDGIARRSALLDTLADLPGVTLVEIRYPTDWSLLTGGAFNAARLSERTEPFRHWLREDLTKFGVSVLSWLQGLMLSGDEWITAQRAKHHLLRAVLDGPFDHCDVLLQTSPVPFDILGLPEIGFPIGFTAGMPTGAILGGAPYEEDRLLEVVAAYQAVTDWHRRRPADPVLEPVKRVVRPLLNAVEAAAASA
ncbi:amidase [Streptomyces sp. BRA346]|uniref:amidase n=1 Tax=Streptomyces sp. BRA346 TaxID=2878199 RepID=UPI00406404A5